MENNDTEKYNICTEIEHDNMQIDLGQADKWYELLIDEQLIDQISNQMICSFIQPNYYEYFLVSINSSDAKKTYPTEHSVSRNTFIKNINKISSRLDYDRSMLITNYSKDLTMTNIAEHISKRSKLNPFKIKIDNVEKKVDYHRNKSRPVLINNTKMSLITKDYSYIDLNIALGSLMRQFKIENIKYDKEKGIFYFTSMIKNFTVNFEKNRSQFLFAQYIHKVWPQLLSFNKEYKEFINSTSGFIIPNFQEIEAL